MFKGLSEADLKLLGYTEVSRDKISDIADSCGDVFHATTLAGLRKVSDTFVYLKSKATRKEAENLLSKLSRKDNIYVIAPKSLKSRFEISNLCTARNTQCLVYEDMIWERVYSLFKDYVDSLSENIGTEKYYVQPRREGDSKSELDRELIGFLKGSNPNDKGKLLVLSASAGVGKTTIARYITVSVAQQAKENQRIPIYVEAQHWSKLQLDSVDGLWDIIKNSLSQFSSSLHITEDLFEHMLQHGLLCFIFDGFDELCGHRHFPLRANEVLTQLSEIARDSEARLILTTRTQFWESEIANVPSNVMVAPLAPFNSDQAKGYFAKYFAQELTKRDQAFSFYKSLEKHIQPSSVDGRNVARAKFINLPFCVNLVAECVKLGATNEKAFRFDYGIAHGFLKLICDREQERQALIADADQQLLALEELTMELSDKQSPEFDLDMLELIGINPKDISKMISHPLIQRTKDGKYKFAYDFLPFFFKAKHLSKYILDPTRKIGASSLSVVAAEANGKGFILDHLYDITSRVEYKKLGEAYHQLPPSANDAKSFFFHLIETFVGNDQSLVTKRERTDALFKILCPDTYQTSKKVMDLVIIGKIDGLDLSDVTFRNCRFVDVSVSNCSANQNTYFENCTFFGELDFVNCLRDEWATVRVSHDTIMHPPSNLVWEKFAGGSIGSKEEHIRDAMRLGLSKFWRNGRLKGTLRKINWTAGSLGHSVYCKPLLDAMLRMELVADGHISGVEEGGYIFDRGSIGDLQRFMDSRQLTGKIRQVYEVLIKETE